MALRLRRGTDAERQLITPLEGELIYATDTKSLYVGDGETIGGVLIAASGEVSNTVGGLLDTDLAGLQDGDVLVYNGLTNEWINQQSALEIDDLTDIVINSAENLDFLGYDGNIWTNFNIDEIADLTSQRTDINELSGTVINDPKNFDVFYYDGNAWANTPITSLADQILSKEQTHTITIAGDDSTILVDPVSNIHRGDFYGSLYDGLGNEIINEFTKAAMVDVRDPTDTYTVLDNFTGDLRRGENGQVIIQGGATPVFIGSVDGPIRGTVVGPDLNVVLNHDTGTLYGDVVGSVFGDDSNLIIDGITGTVRSSTFESPTNTVTFGNNDDASQSTVNINSSNERSQLDFTRSSETDLSGDTAIPYGMIRFTRNDVNGTLITGLMQARENAILVASTATGDFANGANYFSWKEQKFGIGTINPTATLDVQGAIKPGVYADTAARDAAITSPVEGMLAFLQDTQKFVGYVSDTGLAGGGVSNSTAGWVDLY